MNALYLVAALGLLAVTYGLPMPQQQTLVPGVFIPADAFKNLQDRANANNRLNSPQPASNPGYPPNTNPQNIQPIGNQAYQPNTSPPNIQTIGNQGYQPNTNVQNPQPMPNQGYQPNANIQNPQSIPNQSYQPNTNIQNAQPIVNPAYQVATNIQTQQPGYQSLNFNQPQTQPGANNQAQPLIVGRISGTNSNQPTALPMNQPNVLPLNQPTTAQSGQAIVYVQQQPPNQQTIFVPQSNQPVQQPFVFTQSPTQGFGVQNGQFGQPTKVVFANPSFGNQGQGQNTNTVYTLIPLNGQNPNSNTGSYLIPIQSGGSSPFLISSGKL